MSQSNIYNPTLTNVYTWAQTRALISTPEYPPLERLPLYPGNTILVITLCSFLLKTFCHCGFLSLLLSLLHITVSDILFMCLMASYIYMCVLDNTVKNVS